MCQSTKISKPQPGARSVYQGRCLSESHGQLGWFLCAAQVQNVHYLQSPFSCLWQYDFVR